MRASSKVVVALGLAIGFALVAVWQWMPSNDDKAAESVVESGEAVDPPRENIDRSEKVSPLARPARQVSDVTTPPRFKDITVNAGVGSDPVEGVAFVDLDDDGWPDITAVGRGGLRVFRNQRDGTFVDIGSLFPAGIKGTGVVWSPPPAGRAGTRGRSTGQAG